MQSRPISFRDLYLLDLEIKEESGFLILILTVSGYKIAKINTNIK